MGKDMRILVACFSGTGNTRLVGEAIVEELKQQGYTGEAWSVEKIDPSDVDAHVLGVGFPSYGLCYPRILEPFFAGLEKRETPVATFVFSTHAWSSGDSLTCAAEKLREKNYMTVARQSFKCPSNGARTFFSPDHFMHRKMVRFEDGLPQKIREFADRIHQGVEVFRKAPFHDPGRKKWINEVAGFVATHLMEKRLYKDFKVIKTRCIGCGRCVSECPDDNLRMTEGKAEFLRGNDCLRCMRCIGICPVNAILFGERSRGKGRYTPSFRDQLFQEAMQSPDFPSEAE
jgi:NAD-dependent dihydropyrimidine dehydrogenase PreA subunit/flavodoxin